MLSSWSPCPTLANRPDERHHLHPTGTRRPQRRGSSVRRRPGRVHVVDEADPPWGLGGAKRAPDVAAPLREREPALAREPARPRQDRRDRELPAAAELPREPLRRVMAAATAAVAVRRHEGERVDPGPWDDVLDDGRGRRD